MKFIRTTATQVKKLKQAARQRRDRTGEPLMAALDAVSREAGYDDFHHVNECLKRHGAAASPAAAPSSPLLDAIARFARDRTESSFLAMDAMLRPVFCPDGEFEVEAVSEERAALEALALRDDLVPWFAHWADAMLSFPGDGGRGFGLNLLLEPLPRQKYPVALGVENVAELQDYISKAVGAPVTLGVTAMLAIDNDPSLLHLFHTSHLELNYCQQRARSGALPPSLQEPNPPLAALEGERYYLMGWVSAPPGEAGMNLARAVEMAPGLRGRLAVLRGGKHRLAVSVHRASVGPGLLFAWYSDVALRLFSMATEIQSTTGVSVADMTATLVSSFPVDGAGGQRQMHLEVEAGDQTYAMEIPRKASPVLLFMALRATTGLMLQEVRYRVDVAPRRH